MALLLLIEYDLNVQVIFEFNMYAKILHISDDYICITNLLQSLGS